MNKDFFENFDQRISDFASRLEDAETVRGELVLTTGRAYVIEKVVQTEDGWVQLDARDAADEETPVSIALPYHQIGVVLFTSRRTKMRSAGFAR